MLEPIWSRLDPSTTLGHGELPQTTSLKGKIVVETLGGEIIVNTLEPIPDRFGSEESKRGFGGQSSPWQVNVAADAGSAGGKYITRRPLNKQGSEEFFQDLIQVVGKCNADHPECRLAVDGLSLDVLPELPRRVIDVANKGQLPRLVVSNGRRENYVTLSHCWGGQRWVATTTESLHRMLNGFDLAAIPKTYADAITVTRNLGIQFIWIDTFCIIQDDRNDWAVESQKMGEIYEKAYCNIAATGAEDGKTGFLGTRREGPIHVRVPAAADHADYFYFTSQADSDFNTYVNQAKINTRGWVMQERLLSRRIIHFAADMWYWECGEYIVSEDGWKHDTRNPSSRSSYSLQRRLARPETAIGLDFRPGDSPNSEGNRPVDPSYSDDLWTGILHDYSMCDLTFSSDKLPALQGLVNRFKQVAPSPYVFGHWIQVHKPLPLSLMWAAATDGGLDFPAEKLAPSWSCLKGNGPVEFWKTHGKPDCTEVIPCTRVKQIEGTFPSILLGGWVRTATVGFYNGEKREGKRTLYSLNFKSETQYGTFTNIIGPANFDDAADVPEVVILLLAYEALSTVRWATPPTDKLALVLREVGSAESQDVGLGDLQGEKEYVRRYKRVGIARVVRRFFNDVPFSTHILM